MAVGNDSSTIGVLIIEYQAQQDVYRSTLNMDVSIQKYKLEDKPQLVRLIEELQDYLAAIDPLGRLRRLPGFGEVDMEDLFKELPKQNGMAFLAWSERNVVGFIAGVIEDQSVDDLLSENPSRSGRIVEMIVRDKYRRRGIGKKLIIQMEDFFRENGCNIVRVEVFTPNAVAREFYKQEQYHDRVIDMVKPL